MEIEMGNDVLTGDQPKRLLSSANIKNVKVKDIHEDAQTLLEQHVSDFMDDLRLQANILARNDDNITSKHVKEALPIILAKRDADWQEQLLLLIAGTCLGASLSGFITEARADPVNIDIFILYTFIGFIGAGLIIWYLILRIRK